MAAQLIYAAAVSQMNRCRKFAMAGFRPAKPADYIAKTVELAAEAGSALAHSRESSVEHIGNHCQQYHIAGHCKTGKLSDVSGCAFAGKNNCSKAAYAVENRYQRRQNRDVL